MVIFNNGPGSRVGMQVGTIVGDITVNEGNAVVTGATDDEDEDE